MVIRCERCSTMYELDESLLAPTGSEVQCTKCQHVFTAFPPKSAGRTLVGVPPQQQPAAPAAEAAAPPPAASPSPAAPPTPEKPATAPPAPAAKPEPRPVRTSAPAVYRPQASGAGAGNAPVPRSPMLKRDTVGTFEARLRWSARWRWLAPLLAVGLVLVVAAAAWALLGRRGDGGADRTRSESVALLALDDSASVDGAVSRLAGVVNKRPKLRAAAADRALALVVRAAGTAEDAEALAARAADLREERERARREQGPGWQDVERTASAELSRTEPEVRAREEKTRALSSGARDQLAVLHAEVGEMPEVVRALALLHAQAGERDRLHRIVRVAREKGLRDPWIELADGWGDARDPDRAGRERALVKLGALAAARPDLLRGRYLLARAQLSLGRKAEALATIEGVLVANSAHEGARRLRDDLTRATPQPPVAGHAPASSTPASPPPPVNPAPQRRKPVSQPGPSPSAAAPGTVPAPEAPAPAPQAPPPPAEVAPAPAPAPVMPAPEPPAPTVAPAPPARRGPVGSEPGSTGG